MSNGSKNCTNCKWFKPHDPTPPEFPGECRRYPPHQRLPGTRYRFIQVDHADWCGEHKTIGP